MGILNVTPDSFSDGGHIQSQDDAKKRIEQMIEEGADIIDVGAESTRPGAKAVSPKEEKERLKPILELIETYKGHVLFSLDSRHLENYAWAIDKGMDIINDVSATQMNPKKVAWLKKVNIPYVAMHMKGDPQNMQQDPYYEDVCMEIFTSFKDIMDALGDHYPLILDPGIGFGKNLEHNLALLKGLDCFWPLNKPLLLGMSRKSFIGQLTGAPVERRLAGSIAAALYASSKNAAIIRVHDLLDTKQAIQVWEALNR